MARVETIVVGGGIGAGSPFGLNFVPYISSTDPPLLASTAFMFVVPSGATQGLILNPAGTDPAAGPEVLRVKGGVILEGTHTDSTVIGDGTDSGATGQIAIGNGITPSTGTNNIYIGNAVVGGTSSGSIIIGQGSSNTGAGFCANGTCTVSGSLSHTIINGSSSGGSGAHVNIGGAVSSVTGVVAVGAGQTVNGGNTTSVGHACTVAAAGSCVFGSGATSTSGHTNSIAIGNGCGTIAAQTFSVGSNVSATPINQMVIGHGLNTLANPTAVLIRLTNGSGSNNTAGALTLQAGLSTGNIVGPGVNLDAGIPGASGVTLQTARTWVAARPTTTALDTGLMVYDVDNATLERVSVGVADSGGVGFKLLRIPN